MEKVSDVALKNAVEALGYEATPERVEHFRIFAESFFIFAYRPYKKGWKKQGWRGNLSIVLQKSERLRTIFWMDKNAVPDANNLDDAYDLLNYVVFFIRNAWDDNELGQE